MRGWLRKVEGPSEPRVVEALHPAVIRALAAFESREDAFLYVGDDDGNCWRYPLEVKAGRFGKREGLGRLEGGSARDIAVVAKERWLAVSSTHVIGDADLRLPPRDHPGERLVSCGFLNAKDPVPYAVTGSGRVLYGGLVVCPKEGGQLTAVAEDRAGGLLWLGFGSGSVAVFGASAEEKRVTETSRHEGTVLSIAPLAEPKNQALSGDRRGHVRLQFGAATVFGEGGAVLAIVPLPIDGKPHVAVARRPPEGRNASVDEVTVWPWPARAGSSERPVARLRLNDSVVRMAVLPGGRLAIALADGMVRLWRPGRDPKGEFSRLISRHSSPISALVVLTGGRVISAAGRTLAMWIPHGGALKEADETQGPVPELLRRELVRGVYLVGTRDGRIGLERRAPELDPEETAPRGTADRGEPATPLVYRAGESVVGLHWDPRRWTIGATLEGGREIKLAFEPWASEAPPGPTLAEEIRGGRVRDRRGVVEVLRALAERAEPGPRGEPNFVRYTPDAVFIESESGGPTLYPHPPGKLTVEHFVLLYVQACFQLDHATKRSDSSVRFQEMLAGLPEPERKVLEEAWRAARQARRRSRVEEAGLPAAALMSARGPGAAEGVARPSKEGAADDVTRFLEEITRVIEAPRRQSERIPEPVGVGAPTILVFGTSLDHPEAIQAITETRQEVGSLGSLKFANDKLYGELASSGQGLPSMKSAALVVLLVGDRLSSEVLADPRSLEADEEFDASYGDAGEVDFRETPTYRLFQEARQEKRECLVYEVPLPESSPRIDGAAIDFLEEARRSGGSDIRVGVVAGPEELKARLRDFFKRASSSSGGDVPSATAGDLESRYRKDWVGVECGEIRLPLGRRRGLPEVALEDVYVRLRGEPTEVYERRMERDRWRSLQRRLFLDRRELSEEEYRARRRRLLHGLSTGSAASEVAGKSVELGEAVLSQPAMVILGDPGSGKTTLLKWVALQAANGTGELGAGGRLPVFVRVSDFAGRLAEASAGRRPYSLETYLRTQLRPPTERGPSAEQVGPLVARALHEGRAVVLLDGLDELGTGLRAVESRGAVSREDVLRHIEEFLEDWIDPGRQAGRDGNTLVVTSRIAGYNAAPLCGPSVKHYTIEPMDDEAIARFCGKWCEAVGKGELKDGLAAALLDPGNPRVRELATNPLLVSILADVYSESEGGGLPDNRVKLYRKTLDCLLTSERVDPGRRQAALRFLGRLAYVLHDHYPSGLIGPDDFDVELKGIRPSIVDPVERAFVAQPDLLRGILAEEFGLLAERGDALFGFLHLTFQEFLAAQHLISERESDAVRERIEEPRWREPLLMALGSTQDWDKDRRDAFLGELLDVDQVARNAHLPPPGALLVAAALPEFPERVEVSAEVLGRAADRLLSAADPRRLARFPDLRRKIEEALLTLRERDRATLDAAIVRALQAPDRAAVMAAFVRPLGWFSEAVVVALLEALPFDDEGLGWPIERCLQELASPEVPTVVPPRPKPAGDDPDEKPEQRARRRARRHIAERLRRDDERRRAQRERHDLGELPGPLPFREALEADPTLVDRIRSDPMWLRLTAALYGGYADARAEEIDLEYRSLAMFLQRSDQARERTIDLNPEPFLAIGGPDDPIYQIAVYLDTRQAVELPDGTKVSRQALARRPPSFDPSAIYRDRHPLATELLIEALKEGRDRDRLREDLLKLWEARGEAGRDALLALAALGDERVPALLADPDRRDDAEAARRLLSRSAAALRDAVYRLAVVQRFERLAVTRVGTHEGAIYALKALPDGRLASGSADRTIRIWDLRSDPDEQRPPLQGHEDAVWALEMLPDGRLASASADRTIRTWNVRQIEGDPQASGRHDGAVFALKALSDGRLASGSADMTVRRWDLASGTYEEVGRHRGELVASLDELPDGRLVSGSYDRTVRIWGRPVDEPPAPPEAVAAGGWLPIVGRLLEWFGVQAADPARPPDRLVHQADASVQEVAVLRDGRIAFGALDHTLWIWGPRFDLPPRRLGRHAGPVYALKALSDGRLASGSADMTARLWDPDGGEDSWTLLGYHDGAICALEELADGRIATGSSDKSVRVWNRPDAAGPPPTFWDRLVPLAAGTDRDVAAVEALLKTLVRSARLPVNWPTPLLRVARRPLLGALVADGWYMTTLGMSDDATYNLAVLADTLPPGDTLTATILAADRSPNRRWGGQAPPWDIETVPPVMESRTAVPLEVLLAIDRLDLSHFRPDLELALQEVAIRKLAQQWPGSTELRAFARKVSPVVLRAVWPDAPLSADGLLDQIQGSVEPADRVRGLLWLADTPGMAAHAGRSLRGVAARWIAAVADRFEKLRCYELLLSHSPTPERKEHMKMALATARAMKERPLERARALTRLARYQDPDAVPDLVKEALVAVEEAVPAERVETLRMLRDEFKGTPTSLERVERAIEKLDSWHRAVATDLLGYHLIASPPRALGEAVAAAPETWTPTLLLGGFLELQDRFRQTDNLDALWERARSHQKTAGEDAWSELLERGVRDGGLTLSAHAAAAIEAAWPAPTTLARDVLGLLVDPQPDVRMALGEWRKGRDELLAAAATLFEAEPTREFEEEDFDRLIRLLDADDDRLRFRTLLLLWSSVWSVQKETRGLSVEHRGREWVEAFARRSIGGSSGPVSSTLTTMFGDLLHDDPEALQLWAAAAAEGDPVATVILINIERMTPEVREVFCKLFEEGPLAARPALLLAACGMSVVERGRKQDQAASLPAAIEAILKLDPKGPELQAPRLLIDAVKSVVSVLAEVSRQREPDLDAAEGSLEARTTTFGDLLADEEWRRNLRPRLESLGNEFYSFLDGSDPDIERGVAEYIAPEAPVADIIGRIQTLLRWMLRSLGGRDRGSGTPERILQDYARPLLSVLLRLAGEVASRFPAAFREAAEKLPLKEADLIEAFAVRGKRERRAVVTILGVLGRATTDSVDVLGRAARDHNTHVSTAAFDAASRLALDSDPGRVLKLLSEALDHPSAQTARWAAHALAAVGRHPDLRREDRRKILGALATALESAQSRRWVFEFRGLGSSQDDAVRIEPVQRLDQAFLHAYLAVAGLI